MLDGGNRVSPPPHGGLAGHHSPAEHPPVAEPKAEAPGEPEPPSPSHEAEPHGEGDADVSTNPWNPGGYAILPGGTPHGHGTEPGSQGEGPHPESPPLLGSAPGEVRGDGPGEELPGDPGPRGSSPTGSVPGETPHGGVLGEAFGDGLLAPGLPVDDPPIQQPTLPTQWAGPLVSASAPHGTHATAAGPQPTAEEAVPEPGNVELAGLLPEAGSEPAWGSGPRTVFNSLLGASTPPGAAAAEGAAVAQSALAEGTAPSLGMQVTLAMASLAESSLQAAAPAAVYSAPVRTLSDLESLEPLALGASRIATMSVRPNTVPSPVLALIAGDMFRLQTMRQELMYASRAMDENGEPPPLDADEALMRQRAIKEVDMGGMWPWHLTPRFRAGASTDEEAAVHPIFRAAFFTAALQMPAAVLPMFQNDRVRFYRRGPAGYEAFWVQPPPHKAPTSMLADETSTSWIALAERAFKSLPEAPPGDQIDGPTTATVLQTLLGRDARTLAVLGDAQSALALWKHLCHACPPRNALMLAVTLPPLAADGEPPMVYGVLGAFKRGATWVVHMCNSLTGNVFMLPFGDFRRTMDALCIVDDALTTR